MERGIDSGRTCRPATQRTVLMGQRLWQRAERDLLVATKLLHPDSYYVAANLAYQAAEKALKAGHWHLLAEEPSWQHDLVKCADRLAEPTDRVPPPVEAAIERLQPIFDVSRYPSGNVSAPIPADLIAEEDARVSIASAEEVMSWVKGLLQRPPGRAQRTTNC